MWSSVCVCVCGRRGRETENQVNKCQLYTLWSVGWIKRQPTWCLSFRFLSHFEFRISLKPFMFQEKHSDFAFKYVQSPILSNLSLSSFCPLLLSILPFSCYLFPLSFLYPFTLPPLSQFVVVNWPREASSCGRASTSVLWTTSGCTGLAASAARTSSRGRWYPPWARRTTPAASSVPPASKKQGFRK